MAIGGGVPTNNEPVNATPRKEVEEGACLLHHNAGVGRGSVPPMIGGRSYNHKEL